MMPIKTLRIPLHNLADPENDCFLELLIEPLANDNVDGDGFEPIAHSALQLAVTQARTALQTLSSFPGHCRLRLTTDDTDLSCSTGAALGLALSPWYLQAGCPYAHFIVTGTLVFSSATADITVGDSGELLEKMYAVSRLGYQLQPTLLLMPKISSSAEVKALYRRLAEQNIAVRNISTYTQAYQAVMGISHN